MAKVSIIIPVYNTEDYLADCVKSLQKQSLQDIEIILVNDASTDRSLEIMTDFQKQDPRIKVISLNNNQGVGEARNQGLKIASGEFIAFVDSDDFVKVDMFEKLYQKALKEQADIVLCDTDSYSSNGKKKTVWYKPIYGKPTLKDLFHNTQPSSRIFSKQLIDRVQFHFLPGMGEGIIFELMIAAKMITTVPEKLYVYRSRDGSLSTTPNPQKNRESLENNRIMGERNPEFKDYFTFKMIEDLLQMVANAVKINDYTTYKVAVKELKELNYLKNPFIPTFYKDEYALHRYIIKVYLLPSNFLLARLISKLN
ncbi:glycosyltransferase family 2 protein [Streptococcus sp. SGI.013]|uniref:Glycosyltransferase involved in cell wall biosynthesis n=1 Tax=Streptococcus porcorum TaxID=701526 RepID=A0ABV2JDL6_9STRE